MKTKILFIALSLTLPLCAACTSDNPEPLPQVNPTDIGTGETNGYKMVWEDCFNNGTLDETNGWTVEVNGNGGGNSELQYYRRENISVGTEPVSGFGCLIITAKKESYSGKTCTSGRLTTNNKMTFKHGKIEARIKLPKTANGLWPAFWMLGADYPTVGWPKSGEIDILEMGNVNGINRGTQDKYFSGWFHWGESWNNGSYPNWGKDFTSSTGIQDDFHLFTMTWDNDAIKFYLDLDKNPNVAPYVDMAVNGSNVPGNAAYYFHKKFFVIFNLAIGGNFTQIWDINKITALNQTNNYEAKMYVDFVRVYQKGTSDEEFYSKAKTAVPSQKVSSGYDIYPVPAKNYIKIKSELIPSIIEIKNTNGQTVAVYKNCNNIPTNKLAPGTYVMLIDNAEKHTFIKE